jgi:hypothetical protein
MLGWQNARSLSGRQEKLYANIQIYIYIYIPQCTDGNLRSVSMTAHSPSVKFETQYYRVLTVYLTHIADVMTPT